MSIPKASRRYFSPALNLWYRAVVAKPWRVQIGLTERGLDDLGDIVAVRQAEIMGHRRNLSAVAKVSAGEDLIHVHWEGYTHTSADEMYHTVWETVEGSKTIPSPVAGHVFSIVDNVEQEEVDEDTVLVEVSCDEASLREAAGEWVEQDEYENRLHRQSPGKFDDSL